MNKLTKIKLTENELLEVIGNVLETLNIQKNIILERDILSECLKNNIICEGLIKSFSKQDVSKVLHNHGIKKYGISIIPMPFFLYKNKENQTPYQLLLQFNNGLVNVSEDYFNGIIKIMDNLGWYVSTSNVGIKNADYSKLTEFKKFTIIFEPKFDVMLSHDEIPNSLYHIANEKMVNKILSKGLIPKTNSMFSNHPERVYMFFNQPNNWRTIADKFRFGKETEDKFVLLEINGDGLNKSNKVFIDQNSNYEKACFTLEPIPPFLIKIIDAEN